MRSKILVLAVFLLFACHSHAQNISGFWQGILYLGNAPGFNLPITIQLTQNGNTVTGTSFTLWPNSTSYLYESIYGPIQNGVFNFQTTILDQVPPPDGPWCAPSGLLIYDSVQETLSGAFGGNGCPSGGIEVHQLKILSSLTFCAGAPVNLLVSGQNVRWYSDSSLQMLVATGNAYDPPIQNTTRYFITQTIYGTQSPGIALDVIIKQRSFSDIAHFICQGQTYLGYKTSGTYIDTLLASNGCDSIRTLHLTVQPTSFSTITQEICQGQTYLGHNVSGTYVDTLTGSGGCDSIRTLVLTVRPKASIIINQSICQGQSYLGHTTTGTYIDTLLSANGCDSIRTLNLSVGSKTFYTLTQSICQGQSYLGHTTTGTYMDTLVGSSGCDSIRTLILTVRPPSFSTISQSICQGQSFLGHSSSGTYVDTLVSASGCDSIRTLHLTVGTQTFFTLNQSICQGQAYWGHSSSGVYTDTLVNARGCDSIRTLILTVGARATVTINQSICQGQSYLGHTASGTYIDTLTATGGCDTIRTLNLTVRSASFSTINMAICYGQTYAGHNTSGTYIDTLISSGGCDSIRTLNLTVGSKVSSTISQSICQGQSYLGHNTSGTYIDTLLSAGGCDSIRTLKLSVLPLPTIHMSADTSLCAGDSIILNPGTFSTYKWQDSSTAKQFTVKQPGTYSVTVTNGCGTATGYISITQKKCGVIFPNAFTPNGDGINDVFRALNAFNMNEFSLKIYGRWGQKVFETDIVSKGWDGTLKGQPQVVGLYIWICRYKKDGVVWNQKGTVQLIK